MRNVSNTATRLHTAFEPKTLHTAQSSYGVFSDPAVFFSQRLGVLLNRKEEHENIHNENGKQRKKENTSSRILIALVHGFLSLYTIDLISLNMSNPSDMVPEMTPPAFLVIIEHVRQDMLSYHDLEPPVSMNVRRISFKYM